MTTFDKREEGFEKKFAHDEELLFKAMARRNKLLGLWAAALLGKWAAAGCRCLCQRSRDGRFRGSRRTRCFPQSCQGFEPKKASAKQQIRRAMDELLAQAVAQVQASS